MSVPDIARKRSRTMEKMIHLPQTRQDLMHNTLCQCVAYHASRQKTMGP